MFSALTISALLLFGAGSQPRVPAHPEPRVSASAVEPALGKTSPTGAKEFRWHRRMGTGQAVEISGIRGDLKVGVASGDEVEIVAVKSANRSNPDQLSLKVVEHQGGVTICSVYAAEQPGQPAICEPGQLSAAGVPESDVRMDFEIRLPRGVRFIGRTMYGHVKLSAPDADLAAHSMFGDIEVELPEEASVRIAAASTKGAIESDFTLQDNSDRSATFAVGTVGRGERRLLLNTVMGNIRVKRSS